MNQTLIVLFFLFIISKVNSQSLDTYYSELDLIVGNIVGAQLSMSYVWDNNYTINFSFTDFNQSSSSIPEDFRSGIIGAVTFGLIEPKERHRTYAINARKIIKLNEKKRTQLNLLVGIGITNSEIPTNWKKTSSVGVGTNYTWDTTISNSRSIMIQPKYEYPFKKFAALSLSTLIIINRNDNYYGLCLGLQLGRLR